MFFRNFSRMLILPLFVSNVQYVLGSVKTATFYGDSTLNGKICVDSEKILQVFSKSKMSCAQLCDNNSTCASLFYNKMAKICTLCRGENFLDQQPGTLFYSKPKLQIDGKQFKIYTKENNEFWHYNGAGSQRIVSSLAQPDDAYVRFIFEKQADGSYKIKSLATSIYMYDGYNVWGSAYQCLNGVDNLNDDHMRYTVTMVTKVYVTIRTKATGRYVRLDEDQYVSSKLNQYDNRSLFQLVEA